MRTLQQQWHAFACLALLGLSSSPTAVVAWPADLSVSSPALWFHTRNGKGVGQPCTAASDCATSYCQDFDCTATPCHPVCHYAPADDSCVADSQCVSQKCTQGRCAYSSIGAYCDNYWDCVSQEASNTVDCVAHKCMYKPGANCTSDSQCTTSHCIHSVCARLPQPPNSACSNDAECISGSSCRYLASCFSTTGKEVTCGGDSNLHCTRLPLGSRCSNDGYCAEGFCRNGTCTASKSGDVCVAESQCVGASICGTTGKCHTPANHTLFPQQTCGADAQCYSNKCRTNLDVTNDSDLSLPYFGEFPEPTRCDYLNLGQGQCRTYVDCSQGICGEGGICKLGLNGDRCLLNDHCQPPLVCGLDGKCYAAPNNGSLAVGKPCTSASQCFSQVCDVSDVTRPFPYRPNETTTVIDNACYQTNPGGKCFQDSDCSGSACRNGVCTVLQTGDDCSSNWQCASFICDTKATGGKRNVCRLAARGESCDSSSSESSYLDSICYSGHCELEECSYECGTHYICAGVPTLGTCRFNADCYGNAQCDTDKKCRVKTGQKCSANSHCLSRTCTNGICAAASTSSTSKSTSDSSTRTSSRAFSTSASGLTSTKATSSSIKVTSRSVQS